MKRLYSVLILLGVACVSLRSENAEKAFQMPRVDPATNAPVAAPPSALDTFEYNGYMRLGGSTRVSITDTKSRKSYWLTLEGPAIDGIRLQQYLKKGEAIIIASGGSIKQLELKKPKIEPLRVAMDVPQAPPPGVSNVANPVAANAAPASVESDEEVRIRMQKVADEIRRRRAERRQLIEQRQQQSGTR